MAVLISIIYYCTAVLQYPRNAPPVIKVLSVSKAKPVNKYDGVKCFTFIRQFSHLTNYN